MKRILIVGGLALFCPLFGLLCLALPFAAFLGAGFFTDSPFWASLIAAGAYVCLAAPGLFWLAGRLSQGKRRVLRWVTLSAQLLITLGLCYVVFVRPLPGTVLAMPCDPTGDWNLDNGSRIAYLHIPATGPARRPYPIIHLHGGPGCPTDHLEPFDGKPSPRPLDRLAALGFDVYYYHQIGCGDSSRLDDPMDYSMARHVEDLEAIRRQLGAPKIILVGLSFGSTLAAHYLATHSDRVERVVFESPGSLNWVEPEHLAQEEAEAGAKSGATTDPGVATASQPAKEPPVEKQEAAQRLLLNPRILFLRALTVVNLRLAARMVSDRELSEFLMLLFSGLGNGMVFCDPGKMDSPGPAGFGAFSHFATLDSFRRCDDIRPALSTNDVPALVLRGECEWIIPEVAQEFVAVFRHSRFVEVPGAGHLLEVEQPEAFFNLVREFILEEQP